MVKAGARHSMFVELGTSRNAARPFMAPAAEKSRIRFPGLAASLIGSKLRGK